MSIEESVLEKIRALPPEKQQEVLDFVEFLQKRSLARQPRQSLKGLWADLKVNITEEDIAVARCEMWGSFPSALTDPTSSFAVVSLDLAIAQGIRQIPRNLLPDMPDRIIAATALHLNLPLVTRDQRIQAVGIKTIW